MAPLAALLEGPSEFDFKIIHTGQHFDAAMSQVFFDELKIPAPAAYLGIHSLPHGAMTGRMLEQLEALFAVERPNYVLVFGDTNSTLAGALAAAKLAIPVVHVEAGLRSFNREMPEELNRMLTDQLSDLLFCPTEVARQNLLREGVADEKIHICGDIMLDVVQHFAKRLPPRKAARPYVLLTVHRQENLQHRERLRELTSALEALSQEVEILCPMHPRTAHRLAELGLHWPVRQLPPLPYQEMMSAIKGSEMVLTDSGGLQKEAFYLQKFCITLRRETEWTELESLGVNAICGTDSGLIQSAFRKMKDSIFPTLENPYGDGDAAGKILHVLSRTQP